VEAKAVSRVEKYFSSGVCEPAHFGLLPFFPSSSPLYPFAGGDVLRTDACTFPDFISPGKIIVASAIARARVRACV